ncbi:hypothetical protein BMF94_0962 [Rhodotorula taiwanensis]|uniref:Endopeptidase S2P n=1 Tax=Rhodotorula taiwanensis TaxID=741276 RepID=A0A2S5BGI0_9BASI|nr:hypothetical protein BMF94_0962 [Rhodotorula taiwanensis]
MYFRCLSDLTGTATLGTILSTLFALGVAQIWHEAGHALAAAAEQIPLLSCGFKLYFFVLPAFYVELPTVAADDVPLPPPTRLRIASAGVWHNLVLALAVWILAGGEARDAGLEAGLGMSRKVGEGLGLWETLDDGVVVTAVSAGSVLAHHLPPGTRITHLDDRELELDSLRAAGSTLSTIDLWQRSLLSTRAAGDYTSLGWCLDEALFSRHPTADCCDRSKVEKTTAGLCFEANLGTPSASREENVRACLDPLALDLDSDRVARCVDAASCGATSDGTRFACARVNGNAQVVRIGVVGSEGMEDGDAPRRRRQRTIWWQGPKSGVLHQVAVTDVIPRLGIIPLGLFDWLERFYSYVA